MLKAILSSFGSSMTLLLDSDQRPFKAAAKYSELVHKSFAFAWKTLNGVPTLMTTAFSEKLSPHISEIGGAA